MQIYGCEFFLGRPEKFFLPGLPQPRLIRRKALPARVSGKKPVAPDGPSMVCDKNTCQMAGLMIKKKGCRRPSGRLAAVDEITCKPLPGLHFAKSEFGGLWSSAHTSLRVLRK
jgi:hypothetical protein